jgi:hypothetical protein
LTTPQPQPLTFQTANCPPCTSNAERDRKKRRKKREPRQVCYRGTFTETSTSLLKKRSRRIPCR